VDYLPTDDVTGMHTIMAAVDELITLLDGQHPPRWLSYIPLPTFVEAAGWRAGMIHEPPHRAEWEKLTTCSTWLKATLKHHFYTKARTAVPPRSATNSRPLRPSDPLYDPVKAPPLATPPPPAAPLLPPPRSPPSKPNEIASITLRPNPAHPPGATPAHPPAQHSPSATPNSPRPTPPRPAHSPLQTTPA
jgi:hypothetical protein